MEQPNGGANAKVALRGLEDCKTRCTEQVRTCERRIGKLETNGEAIAARVNTLEVDARVRSASLDRSGKLWVAVIVGVGTLLTALLNHYHW